MHALFVNSFEDTSKTLVEPCRAGDLSIELTNLDDQDREVLYALVGVCESYRVSRALAAVFEAGIAHARRSARNRVTA